MTTYEKKLEELQSLRAQVRQLERAAEAEARAMQPLSEKDERRMYADQAVFDSAYIAGGRKAPPPLAYERPHEYVRRLADGLKSLSPRWKDADIGRLPDDAFAIAARQIRADATENGRTHGLQAREIRERRGVTDAGHNTVEFVGGDQAHFTQYFARPARRAIFKSQQEYNELSRADSLARISEIVRSRPIVQAPRAAF